MNLEKLTPVEKWEPDFEDGSIEGILTMVPHANVNTINRLGEEYSRADLEFIWLARQAFDGDPEAFAWWEANRRRRVTSAGSAPSPPA